MTEQETSQAPAPEAGGAPAGGATTQAAPVPTAPSGPRRRGAFAPRRKVCRFCAEQVVEVDWKQFQLLRTFTTERGRMLSSRVTGTCAKHQRQLSRAILRARHLAILPYMSN